MASHRITTFCAVSYQLSYPSFPPQHIVPSLILSTCCRRQTADLTLILAADGSTPSAFTALCSERNWLLILIPRTLNCVRVSLAGRGSFRPTFSFTFWKSCFFFFLLGIVAHERSRVPPDTWNQCRMHLNATTNKFSVTVVGHQDYGNEW